ncbi:MAG: DUF3168 domain-containing protein [Hyphomicrobiales bacterium]|nr:MAG: DUF3168 domain-containing protein [Hyphomicrobiales bacterium]
MMEEALRALIVEDVALADLIGDAVYWNHIPQNAPDLCLSLFKISSSPSYTLTGAVGLENSRVQADVRALSVAAAWAISRALKTRLSGFRGVQSGVRFDGIFLLSERQDSDKPADKLVHRVSHDFDVWASA